MKKKILLISRNFPPLVGGMERFVWNVYQQLQKEFSCDVVGPKGANNYIENPNNVYLKYKATPISMFLLIALFKCLWMCSKNKYCICIAGSGVVAPIANFIGKIYSIPVITFVYGLDLVVENKIYQSFFVPSIKFSEKIIAISNSTKEIAIKKNIQSNKIQILYPGVEINDNVYQFNFRQKYNLNNKKILLSAGRLIPRKGLPEFIKYSLPNIITACPDTVFVIIGSEAQNALKKAQNEKDRIINAIQENNLSKHVLILGRVEDEILWSAYNESDLFVFPVKEEKGDIEGFGLVALEAAANGLPTAAFSVGGVIDAVSDNYSGFLVPSGEYSRLADLIINYLKNKSTTVTPDNCRKHAKSYSWDNFGVGLRELCNTLAAKKN